MNSPLSPVLTALGALLPAEPVEERISDPCQGVVDAVHVHTLQRWGWATTREGNRRQEPLQQVSPLKVGATPLCVLIETPFISSLQGYC